MEIFVKVEFGPDILLCYHYYYKPKGKFFKILPFRLVVPH